MEKRKTNSELFPEAWKFFIDFARNITKEDDIKHLGNYRISDPRDLSGNTFIYANCPRELFNKLKDAWYSESLDSPSIYGKIQFIVNNF